MKKNILNVTLTILALSSTFELAAKLIPITIGANDTFELGMFESDSATLYHSRTKKTPKVINNPDFTWYTFDVTGYKGGNKITRVINPGTPHAFTVSSYEHLFIDQKGTGTPSLWVQGKEVQSGTNMNTATLRTVKAPKGTFKVFGMQGGKINKNVGFIVTVK